MPDSPAATHAFPLLLKKEEGIVFLSSFHVICLMRPHFFFFAWWNNRERMFFWKQNKKSSQMEMRLKKKFSVFLYMLISWCSFFFFFSTKFQKKFFFFYKKKRERDCTSGSGWLPVCTIHIVCAWITNEKKKLRKEKDTSSVSSCNKRNRETEDFVFSTKNSSSKRFTFPSGTFFLSRKIHKQQQPSNFSIGEPRKKLC